MMPYLTGAKVAIAHATTRLDLQQNTINQVRRMVSDADAAERAVEAWWKEWDA
jgi:hypothetical protein